MKKLLLLGIAITIQLQSSELSTIQYRRNVTTINSDDFVPKRSSNASTLSCKIKAKIKFTTQRAKRKKLVARELSALRTIEESIKKQYEENESHIVLSADVKALGYVQQKISVLDTGKEDAFSNYLRLLRKKNWDTVALQKPSFQEFLAQYRANKKQERDA